MPYVIALALAVGVTGLYFSGLRSVPGLYHDEASVGYNAWTIAHFGVDQYGNHIPLFFVDFGDYKGPIATYLTVPFVSVLGMTSAAVRAPSVLAGLAFVAVAGVLAYRLTRSRGAAAATAVFTALQPWLFLQSHTMLEGNVLLMLCVMLVCWLAAEAAMGEHSGRWWTYAGVALGAAVYAYTIGRLLALLLAVAAVIAFHRSGRRNLWRLLFPLFVAYVVLFAAAVANPAVLLARFSAAGLFSDHASLLAAVVRFCGNYIAYFNPSFLLLNGDVELRQTTGFGGVILAATLPLMIAGGVRLAMRWRKPYARFVILGVLLSPVPAALTLVAPHALRGAGLFPFLIVMMIEGIAWARALLRSRRVLAGALTVAVALTAAPYFIDFFSAYPARAGNAFEAGEGAALATAYRQASGSAHALYLSTSLDQPAILLMFAVSAPPPQDTFLARAKVHVVSNRAELDTARSGDVLVLGPHDRPPRGSRLAFTLRAGTILWPPTSTQDPYDQLNVWVA